MNRLQTIYVKELGIRTVAIESVVGNNIAVGETVSKGSGDDTAAVPFMKSLRMMLVLLAFTSVLQLLLEVELNLLLMVLSASGGGAGVISTGGIATAERNFVFSTTTYIWNLQILWCSRHIHSV